MPTRPGAGGLQLGRQAKKSGFIAKPSDEMRSDGELVVIPEQRHRHGRLAGLQSRSLLQGVDSLSGLIQKDY